MKMRKGFTLIELLVVIAITGILIAVGLASYQKSIKLSRDARRKADLEQVRQALETYRSETGAYPATSGWETSLQNGYIAKVPTDPKSTATNTLHYTYTYLTPTTYTLCSDIELPTPATCGYTVTNP
jgi:general secretion pathway protein G